VPVHHINVNEISGSALDGGNFLGEPTKVSRQQGGSNPNVMHDGPVAQPASGQVTFLARKTLTIDEKMLVSP
jgi:hypothetical protein